MPSDTRPSLDPVVEDALRMLERCAVFRALEVDARRQLAAHAQRRRFAAGDLIYQSGSAGQSMMAVVTGTVRISAHSPQGKEIILADLPPGEVVGEIAVLDGGQRSADAHALTNCEVLVLERRDVLPFLEQHPQACLKLLELVCQRLRNTDQWITDIAFAEVPMRLAKVLLAAVAAQGRRADGRPPRLSFSQRELGSMVGATRESVNRCLQQWQREGIVQLKEGWIVILGEPGLREIAELA
jgi:CRP/FNR family transcriptional regulator, cyclic AMP receptor protein